MSAVAKSSQNIINHIVLILDASSSMTWHAKTLIKVADSQIAYLAERSKAMDQETRITVYAFGSAGDIRCLIYDKDVLRMPTLAGLYATNGMTALIDATILALDDLASTPQKYGEHAFLLYLLTDGEENNSHASSMTLKERLDEKKLPDNWTIAALVPDANGKFMAKKYGFPAENIAIWDTSVDAHGIETVGETIKAATDTYMTNRASGLTSTRALFTNDLTSQDIKGSLTTLTPGSYFFLDVKNDGRIDEFVGAATGRPYSPGSAFFQFTKSEIIHPHKKIAVEHQGHVYTGQHARQLLGLPDQRIRVRPSEQAKRGYTLFVQSTSNNRKLLGGTRVLMMR